MKPNNNVIHVESAINKISKQPRVLISWGPMSGELTPEEARRHAMTLLICAEAAIQDSCVYNFMDDGNESTAKLAAHLISKVRDARVKYDQELER